MLVIHANDPTTRVLSRLYESREDFYVRLDEHSSNTTVIKAIKDADNVMMLGHGNQFGLFSIPDKKRQYRRLLVDSDHVQFLRGKSCIGIWCYAVDFAKKYNLHGLFSGMIISELEEAQDCGLNEFTRTEIDMHNQDFAEALYDCINKYPLNEVPDAMANYVQNPNRLELFNYNNLYYL